MKIIITKVSSDYWYEIRDFNTLKDIQKFIKEIDLAVIIEENYYTDDAIFKYWEGMKPEDIPVIKECSLQITIYDDYID